MRTKKAIKNIKHILIFNISTVILSFLNRKIFINALGAEYVGINSIITSLISFINLAELGISSAVTFALYTPLKNNDKEKINELMYLFKIIYKKIACIALIIGIGISLKMQLFINTNVSINEIRFYLYVYLFNTVMTYILTYKYTLANSDQKNYLITKINTYIKIIKHMVQMLSVILFKSYLSWLFIEVAFNFIYMYLANRKITNSYKDLSFNSKKSFKVLKSENKNLFINLKRIIIHKATSFIVFQTDSLMISILLNLKQVAIYSNYMMIINQIITIITDMFTSISGSIGNLIAEKDDNKTYMVWKEMHSFMIYISLIIVVVLYIVLDDFISIWVGSEYVYNRSIKIILLINLFITLVRQVELRFKMGYGIYSDYMAPIAEGIINVTLSIIFTKKLGVIGMFLGTFASNILIIMCWSPYMTFKYGFKRPFINYIIYNLKLIVLSGAAIVIINKIIILFKFRVDNFLALIVKSSIALILSTVIALLFMLFDKSFRNILKRGISQWKK